MQTTITPHRFTPEEKRANCAACLLSTAMRDCSKCAFYTPVISLETAIHSCGKPYRQAGRGAYPYDCIAKELRPNSMILICDDCGAWKEAEVF